MTDLTEDQEHALATFKAALHLPKGGFHVLIVELCKQYQLPFQTCRSVLKKAQKSIESKIRLNFQDIDNSDLTQKNWLSLIHATLTDLAKDNQPLMESMTGGTRYRKLISDMQQSSDDSDREMQRDRLLTIYEQEVYKSLAAMLHTSALYWELRDDLFEMSDERLAKFADYTQHVEAIRHLQQLSLQMKAS
ncbi:hypothetical protein [Vibrio methylphosphonaticus]|uniref:hypothetical protein n=1 Tax=Vibrio methylphosphonaticus TaxID=2946866 RepID=UPI00202A1BC2|nr:hypothetical protein [Vibrio methylphosphonaticus]MCL9773785.1 hypothetical protein [Vibrio methylphosphonaticus]